MKTLIYSFISTAVLITLAIGCKTDASEKTSLENKKYTATEIAEIKRTLLVEKKVSSWPTVAGDGTLILELSPKECTFLGGTVTYWGSCEGTNMKCSTTVNGELRETCIDEAI